MSARRGGGGQESPPWIIKKKVKNSLQKYFNLQKAPIVCYARKGPHVMRYIFT